MPTNVDKYFVFEHLPEHIKGPSRVCAEAQQQLETLLPDCAEKSAGMRKLLEAKDCFVRAALEPKKAK